MFEFLIKKLKAHPRKIVFTEGTDSRILEASARLLSGTFLTPVLVGKPDEVQAAAEEIGLPRIAIAKLQVSKSHKSREDDHGNGRCRARTGQVGEDVRRDERQDGLRDRGVFVILDSDLWAALRRAA